MNAPISCMYRCSEEQRVSSRATIAPPPSPPSPPRKPPPPPVALDAALEAKGLAQFGAALAERGHVSARSLSALPGSDFALLCYELGMDSKQTRNLRHALRTEL